MQFSTFRLYQDEITQNLPRYVHHSQIIYVFIKTWWKFKICAIYAIKYQSTCMTGSTQRSSRISQLVHLHLQICGSYLDNKYVQYTNCLKSHQDKRITNTHEFTPHYDMKIPYFSYDKLYFIIHQSIILISNYSNIYAIQINSFARSDSYIQG